MKFKYNSTIKVIATRCNMTLDIESDAKPHTNIVKSTRLFKKYFNIAYKEQMRITITLTNPSTSLHILSFLSELQQIGIHESYIIHYYLQIIIDYI